MTPLLMANLSLDVRPAPDFTSSVDALPGLDMRSNEAFGNLGTCSPCVTYRNIMATDGEGCMIPSLNQDCPPAREAIERQLQAIEAKLRALEAQLAMPAAR